MSTSQKITNTLNVQAAKSFVQSVRDNAAYYVFAAKHTPFTAGSDDNPPQPENRSIYVNFLFFISSQITNFFSNYKFDY